MYSIEVNLRVKFRDDTPKEFIDTLINEEKSLTGFISVTTLNTYEYEFVIVSASSAHYVLKKWLDRGLLKEV